MFFLTFVFHVLCFSLLFCSANPPPETPHLTYAEYVLPVLNGFLPEEERGNDASLVRAEPPEKIKAIIYSLCAKQLDPTKESLLKAAWEERFQKLKNTAENPMMVKLTFGQIEYLALCARNPVSRNALIIGADSIYYAFMLALTGAHVTVIDKAEGFRIKASVQLAGLLKTARDLGMSKEDIDALRARITIINDDATTAVTNPAYENTVDFVDMSFVLGYLTPPEEARLMAALVITMKPGSTMYMANSGLGNSYQETGKDMPCFLWRCLSRAKLSERLTAMGLLVAHLPAVPTVGEISNTFEIMATKPAAAAATGGGSASAAAPPVPEAAAAA